MTKAENTMGTLPKSTAELSKTYSAMYERIEGDINRYKELFDRKFGFRTESMR